MKIHNYGSDYAFQQRQKLSSQNVPTVTSEIQDKTVNETETYVEHQVQTGGEGAMATDPEKDGSQNTSPETPKASKKKKKQKDSD